MKMEHRAVMKSTSGKSSGGDCCNSNLSGSSLFKASVSSLFNKGNQHGDDFQYSYAPKKSTAKKSPRSSIESTGTCDSNGAHHPHAEQPTIRAQEIPQSHSLEQRFLSKMRESGVVTSAGYQAVLHDFLTSDRDLHNNNSSSSSSNNNTSPAEEVTPTDEGIIDRRAEMLKARKRSSRRGSSRRFGSFFTACASSYNDDEDLLVAAAAEAFNDDTAPDRTTATLSSVNNNDDVTDRRAEFINSGRKGSSRRGSTRLFGSFFTACADDHDNDFNFNASYRNCTAENIAPLRRSNSSQIECIQSSSVEKEEEVASVVDHHHDQLSSCSQHWSIASSLSDSIHIVNSDNDDELRMKRCEGNDVALQREDSCNSLDLEEIFDGTEGSHVMKPTPSKENSTSSTHDNPTQKDDGTSCNDCTKKSKMIESSSSSSLSISEQEQRKSSLESSSSTLDECGWLPWPEQKKDGDAREGEIIKDDGSDIAVVPLYGDDEFSFLPWPDTPKNFGRATAA
jgi:hypothetical protein